MDKNNLEEFQKICSDEFGVEFEHQVSAELAERYLTAFKSVYRPIPQSYVEEDRKS